MPGPEAPRYAPLERATHQQEYLQLAGPRLEGEQSGEKATTVKG